MSPSSFARVVAVIGAVLWLSLLPASAQRGSSPEDLAKLKVAAEQPTPRTVDGHPDFTGDWDAPGARTFGSLGIKSSDGSITVTGIASGSSDADRGLAPAVRPAPHDPNPPSYKPEFLAKVKDLAEHEVGEDPGFHCRPLGVPRIGPPRQIVQAPGVMVFLYQVDSGEGDAPGTAVRVIRTDGRGHREDLDDASFFGDSVGRWDGDTLVVDVTNLNDETWMGIQGYFHTNALHVVERLTRNGNTLRWEATAEDPNVLTKPWVMTPQTWMVSNYDVYEAPACAEKDQEHFVNGAHHAGDGR